LDHEFHQDRIEQPLDDVFGPDRCPFLAWNTSPEVHPARCREELPPRFINTDVPIKWRFPGRLVPAVAEKL
jgi:hypothetical protein